MFRTTNQKKLHTLQSNSPNDPNTDPESTIKFMDFVSMTPKQSARKISKLAAENLKLKPRKSLPKIGERRPKIDGDVSDI